uniref:hypothetical protein n=1 Tax=Verrucomicrobium sp. BvORR106 TaxID=1403819 RepID=UPI000570BC99
MPYYSLEAPLPAPWMDVEKAATDWDGWMQTLDEEKRAEVDRAFTFSTPETLQADRKRFISVASVAQDTGIDAMEISTHFENLYQPLYANQVLGKNEVGVGIEPFFNEIVGRKKKSREEMEMLLGLPEDPQSGWLNKAYEGGVRGEPWVYSFARSLQEMQGKPGFDVANKDVYLWQYATTSRAAAEQVAPYRALIDRSAQQAKAIMGVEGKTDQTMWDIATSLIQVPAKDRKMVIKAIGITGASDASGKDPLQILGENIARGTADFLTDGSSATVRKELMLINDELKSGLFPGDAPIASERDAIGTIGEAILRKTLVQFGPAEGDASDPARLPKRQVSESEKALATAAVVKLRDILQLRSDIKEVAEGGYDLQTGRIFGIDPATSTSAWPRGIYSAARSAPMTVGSFVPGGFFLTTGQFEEDNYQKLRREFPGMSDETAQDLASFAAPAQALIETIVNRAVGGTLTKFIGAARLPSVTLGGLLRKFAGGQVSGVTMEMGEEYAQAVMPYLAMELARALQMDIPEVPWQRVVGDLKRNSGEIFRAVVPMVLVMNGGASIIDFSHGRSLASDPLALQSAGLSEAAAVEISNAAKSGDWRKAQDLMRAEWKAGRVEMDGAKLQTQRDAAAAARQSGEQRANMANARLEALGVLPPMVKVGNEYEVRLDDGGKLRFPTLEAAQMARWELPEVAALGFHASVREVIDSSERNLARGEGNRIEIAGEAHTADSQSSAMEKGAEAVAAQKPLETGAQSTAPDHKGSKQQTYAAATAVVDATAQSPAEARAAR